jgi:hypothetical protein
MLVGAMMVPEICTPSQAAAAAAPAVSTSSSSGVRFLKRYSAYNMNSTLVGAMMAPEICDQAAAVSSELCSAISEWWQQSHSQAEATCWLATCWLASSSKAQKQLRSESSQTCRLQHEQHAGGRDDRARDLQSSQAAGKQQGTAAAQESGQRYSAYSMNSTLVGAMMAPEMSKQAQQRQQQQGTAAAQKWERPEMPVAA